MKYAKVSTPKEKVDSFKHHASIILRGFVRTIIGALVAFLFVLSIYAFSAIGSETGYVAVGEFVGACLLFALGCIGVYQGGKR